MNQAITAPRYNEAVVRKFVIAAAFWGVVGLAAGVLIALQLAYPALNLNLEWTTFGRLRPVHTSAVIFAATQPPGGEIAACLSEYGYPPRARFPRWPSTSVNWAITRIPSRSSIRAVTAPAASLV